MKLEDEKDEMSQLADCSMVMITQLTALKEFPSRDVEKGTQVEPNKLSLGNRADAEKMKQIKSAGQSTKKERAAQEKTPEMCRGSP